MTEKEKPIRLQRQSQERCSHKPRKVGSHQNWKRQDPVSPLELPEGVQPCSCPNTNPVTIISSSGSSRCGSVATNPTSIHKDAGLIPGLSRGLRIRYYHEPWCTSQMWLRFRIAVAVE